MKNIIFLFALITLSLTGCQKMVLGEDEANNPENNFELFWNDFDRHYALFGVRGWNWDSIYTEFRPQVTQQSLPDELWDIQRQMIAYLDDSHTFIYRPGVSFFASGSEEDERTATEFSLPLIIDKYLETIDSSSENEYIYGNCTGRNIGYLYLGGMKIEDESIIDDMITNIGDNDAIIIDLRNNTGGDDNAGAAIAGRFADHEGLVYTVQERNGPAHTDFAGKTEYFLRRQGPRQFLKPVVLLTDYITVSAAEVFLIYMSSREQTTLIGTPTSGDFSDTSMRRFLPNGTEYQYSIMKFLLPDGTSIDGTGHIPDLFIRNSAEDIAAENDRVLERAFTFLFEEYGIE
ncbi:S41 family peptidase [Neolewinella aurantiaca]|uniref:S41 family peptidase n=1 Tax=Neolewinella aurantiaca TaxID=2602767 RepID=A0A5C7FEY6_9BACT|nr:S41 family peptidase [Neolewinella aurantiaca]TXF88818.1 S41 family peptidase [Neolewinella aurantiaca]